MKGRLKELDILRSVAVLAVISIHITGGYLFNEKNSFALFWNQGMRFSVPLFFIISGFLLLNYDLENNNFSFKIYFKKRISKIIIPYIFWTIFYTIYYMNNGILEIKNSIMGVFAYDVNFIKILLINTLQGTAAPHLYFIVIILQLYILYPFLFLLVKRNEKSLLAISFVVSLYFQIADYLYSYGLLMLPEGGFKYYGLMFFPWIFYFVLGMYNAIKIRSAELKIKIFTMELFLLWILVYFMLIMDTKLSHTLATSAKPTIILYSIISYYFLYSLSVNANIINKYVNNFIKWFSVQSFLIYFIHILVLCEIRLFIDRKSLYFISSSNIGMILIFLSVISISCVIVYIISKIPVIKLIGGVYSGTIKSTNYQE
ncbi:MAG: Acyltransferase family protein [Pelotomaculum sp. PtaB.Bin104]|nr:MAG: Acyltransferase family protein [Pelotomaculum sp. PtaB.Bin104]